MMDRTKSAGLYKQAQEHLIGGVNSPVRAFKSVGGNPLFMDHGEGAHIYDADQNEYIDYVGSYGPLILGHNHQEVTLRTKEAIDKGTTFGATSEIEIRIAGLVNEAFPSMEYVRFVNSGTEAVMSAIRLARAYTGRNKIIKFAGNYHGHMDALLVEAGSGLATYGLPGSKGVPEASVKDTLVGQFNDLESIHRLYDTFPGEIAAIVMEPVTGNMGVVQPKDNFLGKLRKLTKDHGSLLVIDEVMTGFRHHFGGAQDVFDIEADITCLGKVIGGGFPVGAYGGRKDIMEMVSPLGPVYQAGTLSGNPIAMTAGYYTLKTLKENPNLYTHLNTVTETLAQGMRDVFAGSGIPVQVNSFGSMVNPFFTDRPVETFADVQSCDTDRFSRFFWEVTDRGIYIPPSQFESWFVSTAHTERHVEQTLNAIRESLKKL